jgi:acetyltransferase-like isoleucine patch superfamily enzyme
VQSNECSSEDRLVGSVRTLCNGASEPLTLSLGGAAVDASLYQDVKHSGIMIWRPRYDESACFLLSTDGAALNIIGDEFSGTVLSYVLEPAGENSFYLRNPSTGRPLVLDPESGAILANLDGGPTSFRTGRELRSGEDGDRLSLLRNLARSEDRFVSPAQAERLIGDLHPLNAALIASYLRLFTKETLRALAHQLSLSPSYSLLFPFLRDHLSQQSEYIWGMSSRKRMESWIAELHYTVGDHTYGRPTLWAATLATLETRLTIGRFCSIAEGVDIVMANHKTDTASTYPFAIFRDFWPGVAGDGEDSVPKPVIIGNDVWIGAGACILPGTRIGDGAVISAHAVARGSIPAYAVYGGNPGKVLKYRFDEVTIERLLRIRWWDWPDWKIDRHLHLMMGEDITSFLKVAESSNSLSNPGNLQQLG